MAENPLFVVELIPESQRWASGLSFGLAGVSFAAVIALSAASAPDVPLWWASLAFGCALPTSIAHALIRRGWAAIPLATSFWRFITGLLSLVSHLLVFLGIALVLHHASPAHAISFVAVALASVLLWFCQQALFRRIHRGRLVPRPSTEEPKQ